MMNFLLLTPLLALTTAHLLPHQTQTSNTTALQPSTNSTNSTNSTTNTTSNSTTALSPRTFIIDSISITASPSTNTFYALSPWFPAIQDIDAQTRCVWDANSTSGYKACDDGPPIAGLGARSCYAKEWAWSLEQTADGFGLLVSYTADNGTVWTACGELKGEEFECKNVDEGRANTYVGPRRVNLTAWEGNGCYTN